MSKKLPVYNLLRNTLTALDWQRDDAKQLPFFTIGTPLHVVGAAIAGTDTSVVK